MRSFIAIELPEEIKKYLSSVQAGISKASPRIKIIKPDNIHLTLKFLGEINEKETTIISEIIENAACLTSHFPGQLKEIGAFPDSKAPKVIWVGLSEESNKIETIVNFIEEEISKLGKPKEKRPFSPHLTIARVKPPAAYGSADNTIKDAIANQKIEPVNFIINKISLFKSTLTPQGPIYERISEALLL